MNETPPPPMGSLTLAQEVDSLCDRYEAALRRGETATLAGWLPAGGPARAAALPELARLEFEYRLKAGDTVRAEDYFARFPELAADPAAAARLRAAERQGRGPDAADTADHQSGRDATPGDAPPVAVPDYEILGELGRGAMGVVYKARHLPLNRVVALKMILSGQHARGQERARFKAEAEAVARLQHSNIIQVHEVGEHDGRPFFSLEYCPGGALNKKLDGTPLPPQEAAALVETLARAVHAAHGQNVIHRDLKPANVLLAADGSPKVTDFGLAKLTDEAGQTQSGQVMGTPSYMAPEQAAGRSKEIGPPADVYALGAILYECLTGRPPFKAATVMDTLRQVLADDPAPPRRLQSKTPRDLETICLKCLEKAPGRRYATALELAEDLRRFRDGEPVRARPVGPVGRAARWARRRPALAALLAATAAAIAAAVVGVAWGWLGTEAALARESDARRQAEQARGAEKTAFDQAEAALRQEKAQNYLNRIALAERDILADNPERAAAALDACPEPLRCWEWNYLKRLCHPERLVLSGQENTVSRVAFSPDGRRIACATSTKPGPDWKGEVRICDAETGRVVRRYMAHPEGVDDVAFNADGRRVASHSLSGLVKVWDATTGDDLWTLAPGKDGANEVRPDCVAWSPDGRLLAVACTVSRTVRLGVAPSYFGGEILLRDMTAGKEERRFAVRISEIWQVAFSRDGQWLAAAGKYESAPGPTANEVGVWKAATGDEQMKAPGFRGVAFSADGKRVAAADGNVVRVWDTADGREAFACTGHTDYVLAVAFSPDGRWLASAGNDRGIRVWDAATGREAFTLRGHTAGVVGLAFDADGRRLASCGYDGGVRVWDVTQPPEGVILRTAAQHARAVAADPRTGRLAFVQTDQSADVGSPIGTDGDVLRVGPSPEAVSVWDPAAGKVALDLKGRAWAVAYSPDGRRLAAACRTDVRVWNAHSDAEERVWHGDAMVTALAFAPDGRRLAFSDGGGRVRVWDVEDGGEPAAPLADAPKDVWSVAWAGDGRRIAAAGLDKTVHIWDAETGDPLRTLRGHTAPVLAVAFSPDGKRLASAGWDDVIRIWDAETGEQVATLAGHTDAVRCLAFSDDGRRLASGGKDKTVKVWDLATGQEVLTLRRHTDAVNGVAFGPGQIWLASAGDDGQVIVWGAAPDPAMH